MKAIREKQEAEAKRAGHNLVTQAWLTERYARMDKLMPLREALGLPPVAKPDQSPEEMLSVMRQWAGAIGAAASA